MPFSKYFERNGYTIRIGMSVTIATVNLMVFIFRREVTISLVTFPEDMKADMFDELVR